MMVIRGKEEGERMKRDQVVSKWASGSRYGEKMQFETHSVIKCHLNNKKKKETIKCTWGGGYNFAFTSGLPSCYDCHLQLVKTYQLVGSNLIQT